LAGATKESAALKGKRVALIATGGNVDQNVFAQVLSESSTAAQAG
jgi:threonine dehydratase